jgi:DmsE family decaheme c-type cytochrome
MNKRILQCFTLLLALCMSACSNVTNPIPSIPVNAGAEYVGMDTCLECHDDMENSFTKTVHGRIADFEVMGVNRGCENCHGPGSMHASMEYLGAVLHFSEAPRGQSSAVCIQCHTSETTMQWWSSQHSLNNIGCVDCHKVHSTTDKLLTQTDPELCFTCHQDIKAKIRYPSHHPIKEGKMVCADCHNPHGGLNTDERVNDLCLKCHAAKQGPFTFEHGPVVDNCLNCHSPHGTVANNLLERNEPYLCLQCHQVHFHAGKVSKTGTFTDIYGRTLTSGPDSFKMAFTTKCTQCHTQIHGSDLPSQSVPSRGRALTR